MAARNCRITAHAPDMSNPVEVLVVRMECPELNSSVSRDGARRVLLPRMKSMLA
jgi:hypothetical protein